MYPFILTYWINVKKKVWINEIKLYIKYKRQHIDIVFEKLRKWHIDLILKYHIVAQYVAAVAQLVEQTLNWQSKSCAQWVQTVPCMAAVTQWCVNGWIGITLKSAWQCQTCLRAMQRECGWKKKCLFWPRMDGEVRSKPIHFIHYWFSPILQHELLCDCTLKESSVTWT